MEYSSSAGESVVKTKIYSSTGRASSYGTGVSRLSVPGTQYHSYDCKHIASFGGEREVAYCLAPGDNLLGLGCEDFAGTTRHFLSEREQESARGRSYLCWKREYLSAISAAFNIVSVNSLC